MHVEDPCGRQCHIDLPRRERARGSLMPAPAEDGTSGARRSRFGHHRRVLHWMRQDAAANSGDFEYVGALKCQITEIVRFLDSRCHLHRCITLSHNGVTGCCDRRRSRTAESNASPDREFASALGSCDMPREKAMPFLFGGGGMVAMATRERWTRCSRSGVTPAADHRLGTAATASTASTSGCS
jgi:hypothetical protein